MTVIRPFPIISSLLEPGSSEIQYRGAIMPASKKVTITVRLCETKPETRIRAYDEKCPGFYVSITPAGVATFNFRYWDRALNKRVTVRIGNYHPVHLTIEDARTIAFDLKGRVGKGEDVAQTARRAKAQQARLSGKTVNEIIDEYVEWMKEPVRKPDDEFRPRIESWVETNRLYARFVRPVIGSMIASEVDSDDIAKLRDDVLHGRINRKYKASLSNARSTGKKLSVLFKWAAEAGRRYVKTNPCQNLPPLDPAVERDRVLSAEEIRILWHGLDHPDVPCSRMVALGLKFELVTMLRTKEFLSGTVDELKGLGTPDAQFHIPLKRVKKRRVIIQPLSDLAQEILAEAITSDTQHFIFPGQIEGAPLNPQALAAATRGFDRKAGIHAPGIYEFLGLTHFTPHDLRRTAASLAHELGFDEIDVGHCLDHRKTQGEKAPARVTGVYVREGIFKTSRRFDKKRQILNAVAAAIREIVGTSPAEVPTKLVA